MFQIIYRFINLSSLNIYKKWRSSVFLNWWVCLEYQEQIVGAITKLLPWMGGINHKMAAIGAGSDHRRLGGFTKCREVLSQASSYDESSCFPNRCSIQLQWWFLLGSSEPPPTTVNRMKAGLVNLEKWCFRKEACWDQWCKRLVHSIACHFYGMIYSPWRGFNVCVEKRL